MALSLFLNPSSSPQVPMHRCLPSCPCQVTSARSKLVLASNGVCALGLEQGLCACVCSSESAVLCVVCFMCIEMCMEWLCVVVSLLCFGLAGLIVACAWLCDACGMHAGMQRDCQTELPVLTKTPPASHPFTNCSILFGPCSMHGTNVLARVAHCHDNGAVITKFDYTSMFHYLASQNLVALGD